MAAIVPYRPIIRSAGGSLSKREDGGEKVKKTVINIEKVLQKKRKVTKKLNDKETRTSTILGEQKTRTASESAMEKSGAKFNLNIIKKVPNFAVDAFSRIMNFLGIYLIGWITDKLPKIINAIKDLNQRIERMGKIITNMHTRYLNIMTSTANLIAAKTKQIATLDFGDKSGDVKKAQQQLDKAYDDLEKDWDQATKILSAPLGSFPSADDGGDGSGGGVGGNVNSGDLFEIIAGGEGGYDSINRGVAGDSPGGAKRYYGRSLSEMTVAEVVRLQSAGQLFAVGKYQIIPDTMTGFLANMKIKGTDKFDAATQEKFKEYVIRFKRPEVGRYIRGETNNRAEAAQELAREFASVGLSYAEAGRRRGESRYSGSAGNRASISPESIEAALDRARKQRGTPGAGDGNARRSGGQTPAYSQAVKVGRFLQGQGYYAWQHPDFAITPYSTTGKSGYTGSGRERVMRRSYNSYHNYGEALDFPLSHNSEAKINKLAKYLKDNRSSLGIAELKWKDDANHFDHLHVSFKGGGTGSSPVISGPDTPQGDLSPLPEASSLDMVKLRRLIKKALEQQQTAAQPQPQQVQNNESNSSPVVMTPVSPLNSMLFTSLAYQ